MPMAWVVVNTWVVLDLTVTALANDDLGEIVSGVSGSHLRPILRDGSAPSALSVPSNRSQPALPMPMMPGMTDRTSGRFHEAGSTAADSDKRTDETSDNRHPSGRGLPGICAVRPASVR